MDLLPLLPQALADGLLLGGVYAIVAVGLTMTLACFGSSISRHGDFLAVGLYLTYLGATLLGLDPICRCCWCCRWSRWPPPLPTNCWWRR